MLIAKLNLDTAAERLQKAAGQNSTTEQRADAAVELAAMLLTEANRIQSPEEKKIQAQLSRMMEDPEGKIFTTNMTDECFRSENSSRIANQIVHLINQHGVPSYLDGFSRMQLGAFKHIGKPLAGVLIPMIKKMIRKETSKVILPGESEILDKHIHQRKLEGVTTNLNHLGEAILGEKEALKKLNCYIDDLNKKSVEYISVKISTIYSQLNMLDWEETLNTLKVRLRTLYRTAMENPFTDPDGNTYHKFVNLDMEEYRDLQLTLDLFKEVLDEDEFLSYKGGIVLQAYLPDSFNLLKDLTLWSKERMKKGGNCIKVRIVKGANLAMEKVEASMRHWEQAPYSTKIEVDANYKRMLSYATKPENAKAVNVGIASHNLFDISYAMLLVAERKVQNYCNFEMLEGMAEHIRTVVQELSEGIILYCPAAEQHEFQHAIAYLIRRLDENTSPENFLRHAFNLKPGTDHFDEQAAFFKNGCLLQDKIESKPRRTQNRNLKPKHLPEDAEFNNEADTDFSLPQNRAWASEIFKSCADFKSEQIPLCINGSQAVTRKFAEGISPNTAKPFFRYSLAEADLIEAALHCAHNQTDTWAAVPVEERAGILFKTARILRERRAELIKIMMLETGKHLMEADVEISEAIDFCEYYGRNAVDWFNKENLRLSAKGTVLVTPPWNFPCAIPLGGVAAALVTGNPVIFKPAPEAILTGWHVARAFYDAGIPKAVLQFISCKDNPYGSLLIKDKRVSSCILTGATDTAKMFMEMRPDLDLMAETGGKNSMIITDMCDRDLAISDIIQSAFGHAGQKCSACSLAILEKSVYEDQKFLEALKDAAASWKTAPSTDPGSKVNPVINKPEGKLLRALTHLEEGEEWLLEPKQDPLNPHLWSQGIKLGVTPGSYTFTTEFFGPVLGLVRAENLEEAIKMANSSPYGLTGGIHSLDRREQELWLNSIQVGNAYINRSITGAIVRRQPFGGYKNSAYGRGFKAGGPNYLLQLVNISEKTAPEIREIPEELTFIQKALEKVSPESVDDWKRAAGDYAFEYRHYFSQFHDPSMVTGQDNFLRYTPPEKVTLILNENDSALDIYRSIAAAVICHCPLNIIVSGDDILRLELKTLKHPLLTVKEVEREVVPNHFHDSSKGRMRVIGCVPFAWLEKSAEKFTFLRPIPVFSSGRLELLHYLRTTSVSDNYHRYGNLGNKKQYKGF